MTHKDNIPAENLDVDTRFLLANERTLLAWIRTSLAVIAGGIALIALHKKHGYIGAVVSILGATMTLMGYHRYLAADKAIRANRLPPSGIGATVEVVLVVITALLLAVAQLTILR
jgi:putative membrane protein